MVKIGAKFCGGCNPTYNRRQAYEKIVSEVTAESDVEFSIAEEGKVYDMLLVVEGCANRCASIDKYEYNNVIHVWGQESVDQVIDKLKTL